MNSISAINESKKQIYKKIKNSQSLSEIKELMKELDDMMVTQDDSLQILVF